MFSNTEILVLSIIAAAEKFISINILNFSPLPPRLLSGKLVQVEIIFCTKQRVFCPLLRFRDSRFEVSLEPARREELDSVDILIPETS
ncbi:hypothetical protein Y032_0275g1060 [Ancylostoma ceylanicum]|uniref:Uncharacterized protein n=1 Tax=Ancylostoma ceylanicum TaxID=53326 RepID=A0A016S885_9BILA|nr:hypothetical protein Y032_0275g1060 [Ancylostoma ceylanicum]